jgi:hypothetical protein
MITVATYHRTVPNAKNQEKIDVLKFFSQGVAVAGDRAVDIDTTDYSPTDVAVIQGWVTAGGGKAHLQLRNAVITQQLQAKKHVVAIDSNLFLYANRDNPLHYLRYSFDGIFPTTGIYCDTDTDPQRWATISSRLNIGLKDYRTAGSHILLCLQRNGGWSMGDYNVQQWVLDTVVQLRKHTDRPIVIRPHPGDKAAQQYLDPANPQCRIPYSGRLKLSTNSLLIDDLKNCWAAVNYNSSPVVGAAIEGYPIFVTDPIKSQCREIANTDLASIETPTLPDRQAWVNRLAMSHWSFDELMSGQCWHHMRRYINVV